MFNKYVLACLVFAFVLMFCGEKSVSRRIAMARQERELEKEIESYRQRLGNTRERLEELNSGAENVEKYARERYYMRVDGEDVYVFEDEK